MDSLRAEGKVPVEREALTILVIGGSKMSRFLLTRRDGSVSKEQDLLGNCLMISAMSSLSSG